MFWLLRPPYLRWLAVGAVFSAAACVDLAGRSTEPYPFAGEAIAAGAPVGDAIEWRDVPRGLMPPAAALDGFAARAIETGEPLTAPAVRTTGGIPSGWWSVPVDLPMTAVEGVAVRLVSPDAGLDVEGIVAERSSTGAFSTTTPGLVAVPAQHATATATAVALGQVIVLLGS